ncbi:hypothetical protein [Zobellia nedashkovskayae]|uniref:hypothetical protein n=1 Tax=Zobellia nedashkovskayae TaxID=2779510 RepID=UPI00188C20F6|nr:hypothetical protein [Zobellia nedashkovskayae]
MLEFSFFNDYDIIEDTPPGYICKGNDFDSFFIETGNRKNIKILKKVNITEYSKNDYGYLVSNLNNKIQINCKVLVVANGANSRFSSLNVGNKKKPLHHASAVKSYYSVIKELHGYNFAEFFFLDKTVHGDLWIFPIGNGLANIGLGIRNDFIAKKKINLIYLFFEIIDSHPKVKDRFFNIKLEGKVEGHHILIGSHRCKISDKNVILVDDSAHLIDPLKGGRLGYAIFNG